VSPKRAIVKKRYKIQVAGGQLGTKDVPLYHLSVYQISRQLDKTFLLYVFSHLDEKKKKRKTKKLSQFLKVYISGNAWRDLVEIWKVGY